MEILIHDQCYFKIHINLAIVIYVWHPCVGK